MNDTERHWTVGELAKAIADGDGREEEMELVDESVLRQRRVKRSGVAHRRGCARRARNVGGRPRIYQAANGV